MNLWELVRNIKAIRAVGNVILKLLNRDGPTHIDIINSSSLPMYFADLELRVLHCNNSFARFTGLDQDKLPGQDVPSIIARVAQYAPVDTREEFVSSQMRIVEKTKAGNAPSADHSFEVDMTGHTMEDFRHKYLVRVHADKVLTSNSRTPVGYLVMVIPTKISG